MATAVAAALGFLWVAAHADVPTRLDVAACNEQARQQPDARASATAKDHADAADARRTPVEHRAGQATTGGLASEDPQLAGMDAEGAKDAAYRAAYRVCMRRKGF